VCVTENLVGIDQLKEDNVYARNNGVNFILTEALGLASYVFVDFGDSHKITDYSASELKSHVIESIYKQGDKLKVRVVMKGEIGGNG